jgi:oligopeptide/dipeptide ABC transporter ATP-binding protein
MLPFRGTVIAGSLELMAAPLIKVNDLRIHFPTSVRGSTVKAVDGVSFSVSRSTTLAIIGESGSGKSTLGRALVCLTKPTSGTLLHEGRDPFAMPSRVLRQHRRDYQIIFQDPHAALDPRMSIHDSVREPLDIIASMPRRERGDFAHSLLERVGLSSGLHDRFPHELSGGQKQRANIARALTTQPKVLVCDEVVAALDVSIQADILNLFADLQRDFGLTYIFITHDLAVASHISDEIAVMYLGKFVEKASAETLRTDPWHPYTQALLSAEPEPIPSYMRHSNRIVLKGDIPSPISPPSGCPFHTRCPRAQDVCSSVLPEWRLLDAERWIACHFPGQQLSSQTSKTNVIAMAPNGVNLAAARTL